MDWKEDLRNKWIDGQLTDVIDIEDFIQQLLDQRDEEIIGKLEDIKIKEKRGFIESVFGNKEHAKIRTYTNMDVGYNKALDAAISTIKENK